MENNDIQQQTDVEAAKAKLEQVQQLKDGRKDPRAGEETLLPSKIRRQSAGTDDTPEDKGIRPVTAKPKKKKFGQKMKEAMFSEDIGNGSVTEYVFFKIMIPSIKRVLSDMANTAINMALGLDPKTRTITANTHTANASVYRDRNYNRPRDDYYSRSREALSELEWDEDTANDIYNQVIDLIDQYGQCSISDVYSIMGLGDRIRSTDGRWGWTSPRGIDIVHLDARHDRNIIDFPSAQPLNR